MELNFNVKGEERKKMVKAIEREIGVKAKYIGVPSCAYQVGPYTIGRNGELEFDEATTDYKIVVEACSKAIGVTPTEWREPNEVEEADEVESKEEVGLTISIPIEKVSVEKLTALIESKKSLIKKALGIDDLRVEVGKDRVSFPWFEELDPDSTRAYTNFIAALCKMSIEQKRIQAKAKEYENEKYAFRCFLLRLGFIGADYKTDRKILLKNLEGSSAFKSTKEVDE